MKPLWTHQQEALDLIEQQPATMLAHDMAVGKSRVICETVVNLKIQTTLIFAPKSVVFAPKNGVSVWEGEFAKWTPEIRVVALAGGSTTRRAHEIDRRLQIAKLKGEPVVIVINYESVRGAAIKKMISRPWGMIVCDESHRIKSASGKDSRFIGRLRSLAGKRVCLSGTPLAHGLLDAFGQYRFLDPTIFGTSIVAMRAMYVIFDPYVTGPNNQLVKIVGWKNTDDFHRKFYSIAHRVKKEDVLKDLPEITHQRLAVELGPDARRAYLELERDFVTQVKEGLVTAANVLTKLLRLQQLTGGFLPIDREETGRVRVVTRVGKEKAAVFGEYLDSLDPNEPVVVFAKFTADLDAICEAAFKQKRACFELSGRRNELALWQAGGHHQGHDATGDVLAVQIQAGGVGIDLTRACYAVYYSLGFSLGDYQQSLARLHRPGQHRAVTYSHLIATDTVDERVYAALRERENIIEAVLRPLAPELADQFAKLEIHDERSSNRNNGTGTNGPGERHATVPGLRCVEQREECPQG